MTRTLAAIAALGLFGCPAKENAPPPPPRDGKLGKQRCSSLPGKANRRLPVFQRPFDGAFPVVNLFDHQTPGEYRAFDPGSSQLSYCGLNMLGQPEGHEGYTWLVPEGTPLFPVAPGVVTFAGPEPDFFCQLTKAVVSGQQKVEVRHEALGGAGFVTIYRHLSQVVVKPGDKVEESQRLGLSGMSGCATEPMLYFAVQRLGGTKNGTPTWVDPYGWDGPADDPWANDADGAPSLFLWKPGQEPALKTR